MRNIKTRARVISDSGSPAAKRFRWVIVALGCLYLLGVAAATVYSQVTYHARLPLAAVTWPESRMLSGTLQREMPVSGGLTAVYIPESIAGAFSPDSAVRLYADGLETTGSMTGAIEGSDSGWMLLRIEPEKDLFADGQEVLIEMDCDETFMFDSVIPSAALHVDEEFGGYYVYTIKQTDGPWGMRYTLVKASVGVGIVGEQYAVLTRGTLENPVAGGIDAPYLYEGMEIRVN